MASLYKALGLLDTEESWVTRVAKLAFSTLNGEYEDIVSAVQTTQGVTLVFDNAHELGRQTGCLQQSRPQR